MARLSHESELIEYKETLSEREAAGVDLCAMANKRGGIIYFGVKNNGDVLGLGTISEKTLRELAQFYSDNIEPKVLMDIDDEIINDKTVIKISIRRSSTPYHAFKGRPWVRVGPTSRQMSQDEYQRRLILYKSTNKDYSSTLLPKSSLNDLSQDALKELRRLLIRSARLKLDISSFSDEQLLKNLHLMQDGTLTLASVILLGTEEALRKYLPYAEIRYGYKVEKGIIRNQDSQIFTGAYLNYYNDIWQKVNARNITVNIPYGMLLLDRKAFEEQTIREAVNNAVIHRDYTVSESSFVMQYQTCIEIRSPGGFPEGVTIENIIDESRPRNKLIADVLYVCELVEQFGNGVNLMFAKQLSLGKQPPDYNSSDDLHVMLRLDGNIQDVEFAKYVLAVAEKEHKDLNAQELLIAHKIKDGRPIAPNETVANLLKLGLIEQVGRRRFMLSKQYYSDMHRPAQYTRQKGLSRNKNKELILQHIHDFGGGKKNDFRGIFNPVLTDNQITVLIRELKNEGYIFLEGRTTSPLSSWKLTDEGERKVSEKKV